MNRLTLGSVRRTIARVLNICAEKPATGPDKVAEYLNEAQPRLMAVNGGKWVGCVQNYRFCVSENCLTMPRQVENVEAYALCDWPGEIRNGWYEFSKSGPGIIGEDSCYCGSLLIDKGTACCFNELDNANSTSRIQVSTVVPEAAGARILLQGYDQAANWIRTIDALTGDYVDGEYVDVINARTTTKYFSKLTDSQKPITNGPVILSERDDTLALVVKTLAQYESDETHPIYRRYLLPGASATTGGCCVSRNTVNDTECNSQSVTTRVKLRHIPVRLDTDWLTIQSIGALKLMVAAILKEDRNLFAEAKAYEADAVKLLQSELSSYEGDGPLPTLKYANSAGWGGAVEGVIGWPSRGGYY